MVEEAVAVLRDAVDAAQQSSDPAPAPDGGFAFAAESQSVCASAVQPDGAALATGCNDFLVRRIRKTLSRPKHLTSYTPSAGGMNVRSPCFHKLASVASRPSSWVFPRLRILTEIV